MNPTEWLSSNAETLILERFAQISAIPRGSYNEAGIRAWLQAWATERGLASKTDAVGNLVIQVPASAGYEQAPTLALQGHLDMVCQKTPESTHDFLRDPIQLVYEGDWLRTNGTTLGADNGIGLALMLAVVDAPGVAHPALELLFTVAEENGLVGADNLDPSLLTAKTLINLDSETVGVFTVGCAGGGSVNVTLPVTWLPQAADEVAFELRVDGLQGGHSGEDINRHRANANKLLARLLDEIQRVAEIRLSALKGGTARNAIPRAAEAVFLCPRAQAVSVQARFAEISAIIQAELTQLEPGLALNLLEKPGEPVSATCLEVRGISRSETVTALRLLVAMPQGVAGMSAEIHGFVETSNNIGILELRQDGLYFVSNQRSSVLSRLDEIISRVEALAWLAGAQTERTKIFRQPNRASPLLKKCQETYQALSGIEAQEHLTHGGLECGIISARCGGLDTLSLGATIEDLHSPEERLYLPSLPKTWGFLTALLKSCQA